MWNRVKKYVNSLFSHFSSLNLVKNTTNMTLLSNPKRFRTVLFENILNYFNLVEYYFLSCLSRQPHDKCQLPWPHFSRILFFLSEYEQQGLQLQVLSLPAYVMSCQSVMTSSLMRDTFGLLHRERSLDPAQTTEKTFSPPHPTPPFTHLPDVHRRCWRLYWGKKKKTPFSFSQEFLQPHWPPGEFRDEEMLSWKVDTAEWKNESRFTSILLLQLCKHILK